MGLISNFIIMRCTQEVTANWTWGPRRWHVHFLWRSVFFCMWRGMCIA